jgi:sulfatase maturation enzyme AslB (radical SAM superfamily)
MKLPNVNLAFIDRNKLWNYSLNSQHDRGKHKARLFTAILDLGRNDNDVEILQTLIQESIQTQEAILSSLDEYGQRYIVDFPITRNQNTVNVRTTWIVRPDEDFPRLVSCYILR